VVSILIFVNPAPVLAKFFASELRKLLELMVISGHSGRPWDVSRGEWKSWQRFRGRARTSMETEAALRMNELTSHKRRRRKTLSHPSAGRHATSHL